MKVDKGVLEAFYNVYVKSGEMRLVEIIEEQLVDELIQLMRETDV